MDSDAARRAAAAEARRQKILARGAERLNRITVGTPLPIDSLLENVKTDLPAPVAVDSSLADADPAPAPRENDRINASVADIDVTDGTSVLEPSGAATLLASSDPMLQQILRRSDVQNFQNEEDMQKAYQNAEQALHVLLNQLAGPAGLPYLTQRQASETDAGAGSNAVSSSGRAEGAVSGGRTATEVSQTPTGTSKPGASGRVRPTSNYTGACGGGSVAGSSGFLLGLTAAVAAFSCQLLGPQLLVALEASRRLRCAAAVALAVALYCHAVEVGHLGPSPLGTLIILQVALIAATRVLLLRGSSATAVAATVAGGVRSTSGLISQPTSNADLSGGGGGGGTNTTDTAAAAPVAVLLPTAPTRFDWTTLVPGLRPLLDKLSSAHALFSGLFGDMAVFVVSYLVLDAWGHIGGHGSARA